MQPRLSICIATLNRASYLEATLASIFAQADDTVEVVVVDGASTDGTAELLAKLAASEPRLRFTRLPVKGGVDQDYCRAVELARGTYCWLFSDDDVLLPGAIDAVLRGFDQGVALVIVNAEVRDRELVSIIEERRLDLAADLRFEPGELPGLFDAIIDYVSFIGCVAIERELWQTRLKAPYLGSEFVHVGVIFQAPLPRAALVIAAPRIAIRYSNSQWARRSFEIWLFQWPRLVWSFEGIPLVSKERAVPAEPWRRLTKLVGARASGAYSIDTYRRLLAPQQAGGLWRLAARAVAYVPRAVCAHAAYWALKLAGARGIRLYSARARLRP